MINFVRERAPLAGEWELTWTEAGACPGPSELAATGASWLAAQVPGTVAGALARAAALGGPHRPLPDERELDRLDWWYRVRFDNPRGAQGEEIVLALGGIATVAEVYLNGSRVLESESMFAAHELPLDTLLTGANELLVCCRAVAERLSQRRRPRARWRTRLVDEANLRFVRTMLLGRAPGFAPSPPVVGVWRPVTLERRCGLVLERPRLRTAQNGEEGTISCSATLRNIDGGEVPDALPIRVARGPRSVDGMLTVQRAGNGVASCRGTVAIPGIDPWWPHTHGHPALYEVMVGDPESPLHHARVGFRCIQSPGAAQSDGLQLRVNDVPVFVRGAVWTPVDLRAPDAGRETLAPILKRVVAAGMNMLRVHGTSTYESDAFYDLCDELGILVWQDFMFANMDYPEADPVFMAAAEAEARAELERLGHRPCLSVLCGSSEVDQQVAMLGLDRELAHGPLYRKQLPELVREAELELPYLPSAPCGPELPFRYDRGVANYFGVGAYRRPLADARLSNVAFASECLAFANVPDDEALEAVHARGGLAVHHPAWKAGVPRDAGEGWDFDDVRDHYLRELFGVDPVALRSSDQERYLDLSRVVTGELMGEVFGEWRRGGSPCAGALVLWLKDLRPGAGWGLLDHRGAPKVALHHLRRVLSPLAVWTTDEGLRGIDVHLANDGPEPVGVVLRVALYKDLSVRVEEAREEIEMGAHSYLQRSVAGLIGRFVDASWAYRFGPPAQDLVAVTLHDPDGNVLSQDFRFPAGRPLDIRSADELGLAATIERRGDDACLRITSRRFAYGVRARFPGFEASDDVFGIEPGGERVLALAPLEPQSVAVPAGSITALNLAGRLRV